mmetsp:Transcript_3983/g.9397  ORF Transcript_3983/g.9397 Transcript_3983/m.9397 type:complete len:84 (-) Transcript_3983:863-1114(-)
MQVQYEDPLAPINVDVSNKIFTIDVGYQSILEELGYLRLEIRYFRIEVLVKDIRTLARARESRPSNEAAKLAGRVQVAVLLQH